MPTPSVHFFETNEEERKNKKALAVDEKRREMKMGRGKVTFLSKRK